MKATPPMCGISAVLIVTIYLASACISVALGVIVIDFLYGRFA